MIRMKRSSVVQLLVYLDALYQKCDYSNVENWQYCIQRVVVVVAVAQSSNSRVILAGYRRLLPFLTGTPNCICIIIIMGILVVVCDYLSTTCGAATFLHLRRGEWHAVPGLGEQEGHPQDQGKGARKADYSVQCGRVGLMELSPAIWLPLLVFPTGQIISGPWYSYCSWKIWFTSCGATSHLGQRLSTLLQILLK